MPGFKLRDIGLFGFLIGLVLLLFAPSAHAEIRVSLVTMGPGDEAFSKFGHDAIVLRDARSDVALVYNYGTFSFSSSNLASDFLEKKLKYWLSVERFDTMVAEYRDQNRTVIEQELDLSPVQARELAEFLNLNAQPANRYYAYDYFVDNCSTRVRDTLDQVLDGALKSTARGAASQSFRDHALRLTSDDLPLYLGLDFGLSGYADEPRSEWDDSFLPDRLMALVRRVKLTRSDGSARPLVRSERVLFAARRPPPLSTAPGRTPLFLVCGTLLGALLTFAGRPKAPRPARILYATFLALFGLVAGTLGSLLLFFWFGTAHESAWANANVLLTLPTSLLYVYAAPFGLKTGSRARWLLFWLTLSSGAAALVALMALPFTVQHYAHMTALLAPIWLGAFAAQAWEKLPFRRAAAARATA